MLHYSFKLLFISASLLLDADVVGQYSSVVSNCVIDVYQMIASRSKDINEPLSTLSKVMAAWQLHSI